MDNLSELITALRAKQVEAHAAIERLWIEQHDYRVENSPQAAVALAKRDEAHIRAEGASDEAGIALERLGAAVEPQDDPLKRLREAVSEATAKNQKALAAFRSRGDAQATAAADVEPLPVDAAKLSSPAVLKFSFEQQQDGGTLRVEGDCQPAQLAGIVGEVRTAIGVY